MITNEVYQNALEIVNAYHEQIRLESLEIKEIIELKEKPKFRNLENVEPGDFVKCIAVHAASSFVKDKEYEVLRVDDYYFEIINENSKKKWVRKTNGHFRLL